MIRFSQNVYISCNMSKAVPLISITSTGDPEAPSYEAQLVDSTVQTLSAAFQSTPVSYPLFVSGNYGKNCLLAAVLKRAQSDLNEQCFECDGEDPDGVYVWPQPVQLGRISLMLLKMRTPTTEKETYMDLQRKLRVGLTVLSSICCVCEDKTRVWATLDGLTQDYGLLRGKFGEERVKVSVFMEEVWCTAGKSRDALDQLRQTHDPLFDVQYRGKIGKFEANLKQFITSLGEETHPLPYRLCRENFFISQFVNWTDQFVKLANMNLRFDKYIEKIPDTRNPAATLDIDQLAKTAELLRVGQAFNFMIQSDISGELRSTLASHLLGSIREKYDENKSTIVLVLMGPPGWGKSTLLNHIVQYYTESERLPAIFKTGNTVGHTTKGSQVLSHPMMYREHQIMLIDLEGLGGAELAARVNPISQHNLISAILTVASVPCILITNSVESLNFVKETVGRIANLHKDFGFQTERIHLLFHDKNITEESTVKSETSNVDFNELVQRLNFEYFQRREVVKTLNKPNLVAAGIQEQRQLFLTTLLEDCLYSKKYVSGGKVKILDLIMKMGVIANHKSTNLSSLKLENAEEDQLKAFIDMAKGKLNTILSETISKDNIRLLFYFNESLNGEFKEWADEIISRFPLNLKTHCRCLLDLEMNTEKAELIGIEACSHLIKAISQETLVKTVKDVVATFHSSAWNLYGFLVTVKEFRGRFEKVQTHFPESREKIEIILVALDKKRTGCIVKSALIYGGQVVLTVGSLGFGAVVGPALLAIRGGAAAAQGVAIFTARAIGGAAGFVVGLAGNVGISTSMISMQKAEELIWVNSAWGNGQINQISLKLLKDDPQDLPLPVLLLIGTKKTCISDFANAFVQLIHPFTPAGFSAFHPNTYTQVLSFMYCHPHQPNTNIRGYVICLRMKKSTSKYHRKMLKIAEMLTPVTSVTCLFVNTPNVNDNPNPHSPADMSKHYIQHLLRIISSSTVQTKTKMLVVLKSQANIDHFRRDLMRITIEFDIKSVEEYTKPNITALMVDVKEELDRANLQNPNDFRRKIEEIPTALAAIS